jgi:hypothetical protein
MNKLLCIHVEELRAFQTIERNYWDTSRCPQICAVLLNERFSLELNKCLKVLAENELDEVAVKVQYLNWFHSLNERIYHQISTKMHVTKSSVYFTGGYAPQDTPLFHSKRVPLQSALLNENVLAINVNTALLNQTKALTITMELERLHEELLILWERQDSLNDIREALENLKPSSNLVDSSANDSFSVSLVNEVLELDKNIELTEKALESKSWYLCKTILGLRAGDRISVIQGSESKPLEIMLETISYSDGNIYLQGSKILSSGSVGKRTETAVIKLLHENEH